MGERSNISTRFQPGNTAGKGPPLGSANNFKSGLRSSVTFGVGSLPAKCNWVTNRAGRLRRGLEGLTLERYGEVGIRHQMLIQTACRFEVVALLSQRWLRLREADMTHDQRLSYLNNIANASERRDKAIEKLGLDTKGTHSILESLYASPRASDAKGAEDG